MSIKVKTEKNNKKKAYQKPILDTKKLNYLTNSSCNHCLTPGPFTTGTCASWYGSLVKILFYSMLFSSD